MNYYLYIYLDPRKPGKYVYGEYIFDYEPFYVGKGLNERYKFHLKETEKNTYNKLKFNKIQKIIKEKLEPIIIFIKNLIEYDAFNKEIELIKLIGRKDKGLGTLTNLTDGGDAPPKFSELSEETRKKKIDNFVKKMKGRIVSSETKQKQRGKIPWNKGKTNIYSKETLNKMSISKKYKRVSPQTEFKKGMKPLNKGKKLSEETKLKLREANLGKKHTDETKRKMSLKASGSNNPMFGRKVSLSSKKKMSKALVGKRIGKLNHKSKIVLQYDLQNNLIKEWESVNQAEIILNISHISDVCLNKRKIAGGYIWKYKKESITNIS